MISVIQGDALRFLRDAGIAGRTIEAIRQRTGGKLPGERVLASAGAEYKYVHEHPTAKRDSRSCSMIPARCKLNAVNGRHPRRFHPPGGGEGANMLD